MKSAIQAISAALEDPNTDSSKTKRWDVLNKFEIDFNHW
jgi:gamma-tubulin complex component 2